MKSRTNQADIVQLIINSTHNDFVHEPVNNVFNVTFGTSEGQKDLLTIRLNQPNKILRGIVERVHELLSVHQEPSPEAFECIEHLLAEITEMEGQPNNAAAAKILSQMRGLVEALSIKLNSMAQPDNSKGFLEGVNELKLKVNELLGEQHEPITNGISRTQDLLEKVMQLHAKKPSCETLKQLCSTLKAHLAWLLRQRDDERFRELLEILYNFPRGEANEADTIEKVLREVAALYQRTENEPLKLLADHALEAVESELNCRDRLNEITESLQNDYFVPGNASILEDYISVLYNLTRRSNRIKPAVELVRQKISNLTEAVLAIDTVTNIFKRNTTSLDNAETLPYLLTKLRDIGANIDNDKFKSKANAILVDLKELTDKISRETVQLDERMKALDLINETLIENTFNGLEGLEYMTEKLSTIASGTKSEKVKQRALKLIEEANERREKIQAALEFLESIEKDLEDSGNAESYEKSIEKILEVVNSVQDPTVTKESEMVIRQIEAKRRESEASGELGSTKGKNSEEASHDTDEKRNVNVVATRRMAVVDTSNPSNAKELLKIINGYIQEVQPNIKKEIALLSDQYDRLKSNNQNDLIIEGLRDRLRIATNDYTRLRNGLANIKNKLLRVAKSVDDVDAVTKYESMNETLSKLEKLKNDPKTSDLVRMIATISRNVEHTHETLKQLQKMIELTKEAAKTPVRLTPLGESIKTY